MAKNKKKSVSKVNTERPVSTSCSDEEQKIKSIELKRPPKLDVSDISFDTNVEVDLPKIEINSEVILDEISNDKFTNDSESKLTINTDSNIEEQNETKDDTTTEVIVQNETKETQELELNNQSTENIELKEIEITNEEEKEPVKNTGCSKKWCSIL